MKRQKRRTKRPIKKNRDQPAGVEVLDKAPTRRAFLRKIQTGAVATLVGGGVSWYLIDTVRATIREQDLSRIGNGVPTVVQIHDPQCPRCVELQREARDALCGFDETELQFLVANIRSAEGRELAAAHGVGHVTLLLFDASGKRRAVLAGPNDSAYLTGAFRRHLARLGNG